MALYSQTPQGHLQRGGRAGGFLAAFTPAAACLLLYESRRLPCELESFPQCTCAHAIGLRDSAGGKQQLRDGKRRVAVASGAGFADENIRTAANGLLRGRREVWDSDVCHACCSALVKIALQHVVSGSAISPSPLTRAIAKA